ncbi:Ger(x)C family spore germination C-terminal domain-containing protein [Paenibacillus harenae]|uniref:Ger(x)C family spore germination C-terminal domain-containing protein n=1 Tax=Paenibacillus harenae TaxID=306543 RepID=UPI0004141DE8|nr:Ger(x)C family spore germination C-terminal domain-containing protein [Paenibacillus harenae]
MFIKPFFLEYSGELDISKDKDRQKLEQQMTAYVLADAEAMVALMQKNKVDSLGLGKQIRNSMSYKEWSKFNWDEAYPAMKVKVMGK